MGTLQEDYTRELRKQLGYLATWLPGAPQFLGDVGVMEDASLLRTSHLAPFGVPFQQSQPDVSNDRLQYQSSGDISIEVTAAGSPTPPSFVNVADAQAGIGVSFGGENAIVISLAGVVVNRVSNLSEVDAAVRNLEAWDRDQVIVTELVSAASATILVSQSRNSRIELTAKADIGAGNMNLADASAGLTIAYTRGMSTQIVCATSLTPLFRAIKPRLGLDFWSGQPREGFETLP